MSSKCPNENRGKRNHCQEVSRELLEAHGDAPISFDPLEETFDEEALLVQMLIDAALNGAARPRRDNGGAAPLLETVD